MTDVVVVVGVIGAALGLAVAARFWFGPGGPSVDVTGLAQGPAAIVFTRDNCTNCAAALEKVGGLGLSVRQVRAEDEPDELTSRGVSGVPTTVLIDSAGSVTGQFGGVPPRMALRRASKRAKEIPSG
ncbi:MAG: hypothetical protein OER12_07435 [Acidimicrobiia bacterium]|nr:hypothetical protein [Acidimicrobiia bacterium]